MKIFLTKINGMYLTPWGEDSIENFSKFKIGDILRAEIKKPRNPLNHARFMAAARILFDSQERYVLFKDFLIELKLVAGHYEEHITNKGQIVYAPKSIRFELMDETEFKVFFSNFLDAVFSKKITKIAREDFIEELHQKMMDFT